MIEPTYSQILVDALTTAKKVVPYAGQLYAILGHQPIGWTVRHFAIQSDEFPSCDFKIILGVNFDVHAFSLTLSACLPGKPSAALCRYDVHDNPHPNKSACCSGPAMVPPGSFHVHRYSECALREGRGWDACAEPHPAVLAGNLKSRMQRIIGIAATEMCIKTSDSETHRALFGEGIP